MALILVCFFFSGMTGLIYEILWTRMIVKVIGGAPFAISIILTVFMGGLGLGSYIASRYIDRVENPLKLVRLYGLLELAIGGYGFILPLLLVAFRPLYSVLYNQLFDYFMLYSLLTFAGCGLLLIFPVICMGATLPILCRFYVTNLSHLGGHVGRLYGLNTIGAAFGALIGGFWLIQYLGMWGSLTAVVTANGLIGFFCVVTSRRMVTMRIPTGTAAGNKPDENQTELPLIRGASPAALFIFAASGFCAMAYEVIWTKLLGLLIGPTTYSFTVVLVVFITGLALGSMFFGRLADKVKKPVHLLIYTQILAAICALLLSQILGNSQFFFAKLIYHFQNSFGMQNFLKAMILFVFMLPVTMCLGATFPLVGKIYTASISRIGKSVGFAYAINTIGAVLGSFCAGFLLVPLLGKENGLRFVVALQAATVLLVVAYLMLLNRKRPLAWVPAVAVVVLTLLFCGHYPHWNRDALATGRYHRWKDVKEDIQNSSWITALRNGPKILSRQSNGTIKYYSDGIAGFTVVLRQQDIFGNTDYSLVLSGKADASSFGDMPTQVLSAHVPLLFHPNPKSVMVLGHASGITSGECLNYPIERLDILEISRDVVKASEFFSPWNNHVLSDSRAHLIVQDGRAHLQLTNRKYDVIISEPSNPWMAGLANLFTRDFFALAEARINEQGIFAQFIHSYQLDWNTFGIVCRSFAQVFPRNMLFETRDGDFLMVGFKGIDGFDISNAVKNLQYAKKSTNMKLTDVKSLYRMVATEDLMALVGQGPIHSDNWPHLEYAAPKAMFIDDNVTYVSEQINRKKKFSYKTQVIVRNILTNANDQLEYARFCYSMGLQAFFMVDLPKLTPQQKEQYYAIVEGFARNRTVEYDTIADETLAQRCRLIQIESIQSKLDTVENKALAYYTLGDFYRINKNLPKAQQCYLEAIRYRPDRAEIYNDLAAVLHMQGKIAEAIENYDKALALEPNFQWARENREKALQQSNRSIAR